MNRRLASSLLVLGLITGLGWLAFACSWRHEIALARVHPAPVAQRFGRCDIAVPLAQGICAREDRARFAEVIARR